MTLRVHVDRGDRSGHLDVRILLHEAVEQRLNLPCRSRTAAGRLRGGRVLQHLLPVGAGIIGDLRSPSCTAPPRAGNAVAPSASADANKDRRAARAIMAWIRLPRRAGLARAVKLEPCGPGEFVAKIGEGCCRFRCCCQHGEGTRWTRATVWVAARARSPGRVAAASASCRLRHAPVRRRRKRRTTHSEHRGAGTGSRREGIAAIGDTHLWYWDTGGEGTRWACCIRRAAAA